MRTDVKLGIVTSMVVVLAAGGYFLFRKDSQTPISLADKSLPTAPQTAAKSTAGKQPLTNASRQPNAPKDAPARRTLPVNRNPKVAVNPIERPSEPATKEQTPASRPSADPLAVRSPDPTPSTPISSASGTVPGAMDSRELDGGHVSRTLMAGNEPSKPASSTPTDSSVSPTPIPGPGIAALNPQPPVMPSMTKPDPVKTAVDSHKVQPGDSFATLAQTYYGNVKYAKFIAESNPGMSDPARLPLGSTVRIPPLPADIDARIANAVPEKTLPTTPAAGKRTYKVKSGDSFYKIAKEQLGNAERWKELLALNKALVQGDPMALQPGQTLVLPD